MTWLKIDDSFYDHPKVFDAPDCAVALWTRAGTWSARNLTDGFVPSGMPARLCDDPDTAVRELVRRGLWIRTTGGYQFHDWGDYQPSSASVKDLRAKRAAAGKQGGQAKAAKQTSSKRLANASQVGKQNAAPTRPDPPPTGERVGAGAPPPRHLATCPYQTRDPLTCSVCASERKATASQEPLPWPSTQDTHPAAPINTAPPTAASSAPVNAKAEPTPTQSQNPPPLPLPMSGATGQPQPHHPDPNPAEAPSPPAKPATPPSSSATPTPAASGSWPIVHVRQSDGRPPEPAELRQDTPDRPNVVQIVYLASRTSAWVARTRIVETLEHAA